jgi:hypothetical protein
VSLMVEMMFGRSIPGFSSDAIRLDQARSTKRTASSAVQAARVNRLKLVSDAKAIWRKERGVVA